MVNLMKIKMSVITVFTAAAIICCGCSEASENANDNRDPQTLIENTADENMEVKSMDDFSPFQIMEYDGTYSLILETGGGYLENIFEAREDEGMLANGYGWEALAMAFIETDCPEYEDVLDFDSEAGMFCVYCDDGETLKNFARSFKAACEDEDKIKDILSKADPEYF